MDILGWKRVQSTASKKKNENKTVFAAKIAIELLYKFFALSWISILYARSHNRMVIWFAFLV